METGGGGGDNLAALFSICDDGIISLVKSAITVVS